jgi:N-acetylmuramoyl-L-alanine amidase CwlA
MRIIKMAMPQSKYNLKCPYDMNAEEICIHNTANDAKARNEASYMIGNKYSTSFHVVVDDVEVVEIIPFNRNAFHAGDGRNGKGNRTSIGIEICYSKSGGDRFDAAEENAAAYIAMLLRERNWGIERVKRHYDYSSKYCPHRTMDLGWQRFLDKIKKHLDAQNTVPENKNEGGSLEMAKVYQNGSTPEPVYADTDLKVRIGSLDPREKAEYLAIDNGRPLVRYKVNGTNTYKVGYVAWQGGCK